MNATPTTPTVSVGLGDEPKQLWSCSECKHVRFWGHGVLESKHNRAKLLCLGTCNRDASGMLVPQEDREHTLHFYHGVEEPKIIAPRITSNIP